MGIEVWYSRRRDRAAATEAEMMPPLDRLPDTPLPESPAAERRRGSNAPPTSAEQHEDLHLASAVAKQGRVTTDSPASEPTTPDTSRRGDSVNAVPVTDPPYSVAALGAPGVVFVVEGLQNRGDATLARDIVWAACRDWTLRVGRARFDWPQPGASGSSAPVLAAFIEKQVEDHGASRVLIAESVANRLDEQSDDFIQVPDLSSLAEREDKLALWRRLR